MSKGQSILTRWLGVGLATVVCIVTLGLAATGRIGMYINPDGAWFAIGMAVLGVGAAVASFLLPLGEEADHGHDHGTAEDDAQAHAVTHPYEDHRQFHAAEAALTDDAAAQRVRASTVAAAVSAASDTAGLSRRELRALRESASSGIDVTPVPAVSGAAESPAIVPDAPKEHAHTHPPRRAFWPTVAALAGGTVASAVVVLMLIVPPTSLSAQAAADRDIGSPPLFGGDDVVVLAASGDVGSFGVGEWATVFATAGDPATFNGVEVSLTGFLTAGDDGGARLSRLVVTHCVIDAQPASVVLAGSDATAAGDVGQWLQVDGVVRESEDGSLVIDPTTVSPIDEPTDPYEY